MGMYWQMLICLCVPVGKFHFLGYEHVSVSFVALQLGGTYKFAVA